MKGKKKKKPGLYGGPNQHKARTQWKEIPQSAHAKPTKHFFMAQHKMPGDFHQPRITKGQLHDQTPVTNSKTTIATNILQDSDNFHR